MRNLRRGSAANCLPEFCFAFSVVRPRPCDTVVLGEFYGCATSRTVENRDDVRFGLANHLFVWMSFLTVFSLGMCKKNDKIPSSRFPPAPRSRARFKPAHKTTIQQVRGRRLADSSWRHRHAVVLVLVIVIGGGNCCSSRGASSTPAQRFHRAVIIELATGNPLASPRCAELYESRLFISEISLYNNMV